jgi:hypothetical protein
VPAVPVLTDFAALGRENNNHWRKGISGQVGSKQEEFTSTLSMPGGWIMQGRSKWFFTVLISLLLMSCSHTPAPSTKVAQQPTIATAPQAPAQGVPAAEIPEKEYNFGTMAEDGNYVHEFRILNKGTGALDIKEVMAA